MRSRIRSIWYSIIRISAFLRKEIVEILRQPRLVLTLILGPFLILLLFGIGYRVEATPVRTIFVVDPQSPVRDVMTEYTEGINPLLETVTISDSLAEAQAELRQGNVDLVVAVPADPIAQISNSEQAVFDLYHREIDPYQISYIEAFARIYTDEVNRRVLANVAAQGQEETAGTQEIVAETRNSATQMREALEAGQATQAMQHRNNLVRGAGLLAATVGASTNLMAGLEQDDGNGSNAAVIAERLEQIQSDVNALGSFSGNEEDLSEEIEQTRRIEEEFAELEELLENYRSISPGVLVSPFRSELMNISQPEPALADFYVPSALALLIQHLAVTFAALSIVRERGSGTVELFRVSPISAFETLLGKYLSYFIFSLLLAAVLSALIRWGLQFPMLGSWENLAAIISALIFAGLGLGFVISIIAQTTSQAVQYSMIILLASIFFSGLFLGLELLRPAVQIVSWMLPATYATQMLQDVMLRGSFTRPDLLLALSAIGVALFFLAWALLQRTMARR
ncbi:MAG: ABC transporter permease [Anaerolineae bacterium]|nr:ABC transporter permease [Anaerolineae bacterium]